MEDVTKDVEFLAFMYPVSDADDLKQRIGTVDFKGPVS